MDHAKRECEIADKMKEEIKSIPDFEIIGNSLFTLIAYRAKNPAELNIFIVGDRMRKAGSLINYKALMDYMLFDAYIEDLKETAGDGE